MKVFGREMKDVLFAVVPITVLIVILQLIFVGTNQQLFQFLIGAVLTMLGLALFLTGAKLGLLPIGEKIGKYLPGKINFKWILVLGFLFGFSVTVAEPDIRVLVTQIEGADELFVPRLAFVGTIALGAGIFIALDFVRKFYHIPLLYLLLPAYTLALILAFFIPSQFLPMAFDSGGVTTGAITVPFILALSIGITGEINDSEDDDSSDSFGLVAMASIGPILTVLLLGVLFYE